MKLAGAILVAVVVAQLALQTVAGGAPATPHAPASPPEFLARVRLDAPEAHADSASFGATQGATSGYDVGMDLAKPPPPPEGAWAMLSIVDAGPSARLARSLVAPAADASWTIRAEVRGVGGVVRLSWNASDLAGLPEGYGVDATHGDATIDALETTEIALTKPDGLWSADVVLRVRELDGAPASPPADLAAAPGAWPGEVALSWSAPEDDGGHPVRRYVLWRIEEDGSATELARTSATSHTDADRPAGPARYEVAALTRRGLGERAAAETTVLGVPGPLAPGPEQEEGDPVADEGAEVPAGNAGVPPADVDAASVDAARDPADPRFTTLGVGAAGQERREVTVFTVVAGPADAHVDAVETPGLFVEHPGAEARASASTRDSARSPTGRALTLKVGMDGHVTSVDVAWLP